MSAPEQTAIDDGAYIVTQRLVEGFACILVDPQTGLGRPLDLFIERAQRAQDLGPTLHPSEWRDGTDKLREILTHARALRTARDAIIESMYDPDRRLLTPEAEPEVVK
jgi:hypothetical protein